MCECVPLYLKADTVFAPFDSSDSSFQARMVGGKKELKKRFVLVHNDCILLAFRRLYYGT